MVAKSVKELLNEASMRIEQLEREQSQMERFFEIHDEMTQLVLNGSNVKVITTHFGKILEYSVAIEDRFHNLLSSHTNEEFSDPYHQERVSGRFNRQAEVEEALNPYFKQVKSTGRAVTIEPHPELGLERRRLMAPIMVENELFGYLIVLARRSNNFNRLVVQATEHAALIYALLMMKEKNQAEIESRLQADFLEELINGAAQLDLEAMQQRGPYLGFNPAAAYLLVMVEIDQLASIDLLASSIIRFGWTEIDVQTLKREFFTAIKWEVNNLFKGSLVVSKADSLLILAKIREKETEADQTKQLVTGIQRITSLLNLEKNLTVSIAVGGVCHHLTDYHEVTRQARLCLELLKIMGRQGQVVSYKELGLYTILLEHQNKDILLSFSNAQLRDLTGYDSIHETMLVETLRTYLANDKRFKETAAACNIHVNGLRYRIQRIEEVGNLDLNDPETCFNLQLALKIREVEKTFQPD